MGEFGGWSAGNFVRNLNAKNDCQQETPSVGLTLLYVLSPNVDPECTPAVQYETDQQPPYGQERARTWQDVGRRKRPSAAI